MAPKVSLSPPEETLCPYLYWPGQEISQRRFDTQGDARELTFGAQYLEWQERLLFVKD